MQSFDFILSPGDPLPQINVDADFLHYRSATSTAADESVYVSLNSLGQRLLMLPGQKFRVPRRFTRITIESAHPNGTTSGQFVVGDGDFEDDRITGTVIVRDESTEKTENGDTFAAACRVKLEAGASYKNALVQLWVSPIDTVRDVYIDAVELSCDVSSPVNIIIATNARAFTNFNWVPLPYMEMWQPNQWATDPNEPEVWAPAFFIDQQNPTRNPSVSPWQFMFYGCFTTEKRFDFKRPVKLRAGAGFFLNLTPTANCIVGCTIYGYSKIR
jgi:hypothetical protein